MSTDPTKSHEDGGPVSMSARRWTIAARFEEPADYGIPTVPSLTVSRTDDGGIELATDADTEPFVRAEQPVDVRR